MSNVCQCCGAQMNTTRCDYCGFVEIIDMDGSGTELVNSMAASHKQNIVAAITELSVVSYSYRWNEAKSRLEMDKKEEIKLADGVECYPGLKWTSQDFGQMSAGQEMCWRTLISIPCCMQVLPSIIRRCVRPCGRLFTLC